MTRSDPLAVRRGTGAAIIVVILLGLAAGWLGVTRGTLPALWLFIVTFASLLTLGALLALRAPLATDAPQQDPVLHAALLAAALVAAAVALATLRDVLVWKPLGFYIAYAVATTAALLAGAVSPRGPRALTANVLVGCALLGLVVLGTQGLLPGRFGPDTVFHRRAVESIVATGSTSAIAAPYDVFVGYHLAMSVLTLAGLSPGAALAAVNWLAASALLLSLVLLARKAFGEAAGAMTPAIVAASPGALAVLAAGSPSKAASWGIVLASREVER
ncbi:MAG TPA: hypothetical protein VM582_03235, partial [Candidatus Thermoplasmatota archaeon]|nr:hypothetical protein [Candidatus Thermoplasmatota archaeon]